MKAFDGSSNERWMGVFSLGNDLTPSTPGELFFDVTKGIRLRTADWDAPGTSPLRRPGNYAAIRGLIEGNRHCTVLDAFDTNAREIVGNTILLGGWSESSDKANIIRLRFQSPAFTALVNPSGISVKVGNRRRSAKITCKVRAPIRAQWNKNALLITTNMSVPTGQNWEGAYLLTETPYLQISFARPVSIQEIRKISFALEFLSCMADGEFSGPPKVLVWDESIKHAAQPGAQLLFSESWYVPSTARHPLHRLFVLWNLGKAPARSIGRWIKLAAHIEPLLALYRAGQNPAVDVSFLFLVQAVEGLHRSLDNRTAIAETDFALGVEAANQSIPKELGKDAREFFIQRVPRFNEPSLASRLRDYGHLVTTFLPNALPKFGDDRRGIVNFRNEFSHALGTGVADTRAAWLQYYGHLLRAIFEFVILHRIEVPQEFLQTLYSQNQRFEKLARWRKDLVG